MNPDLSPLLSAWPHDPSGSTARLITARDGTPQLQVRLDLGVLQMNLDGRPDGRRPKGEATWLAHYRKKRDAHERAKGTTTDFTLDTEACSRLHQEALQFYHRYVGLFHLEDWERVVRDTEWSLSLIDFVSRFAEAEQLGSVLVQLKPLVLMLHTRAEAHLDLSADREEDAILALQSGISALEAFFESLDRADLAGESSELRQLKCWLSELEADRPVPPRERIRRELQDAIAAEEYERAARLRDALAALENSETGK